MKKYIYLACLCLLISCKSNFNIVADSMYRNSYKEPLFNKYTRIHCVDELTLKTDGTFLLKFHRNGFNTIYCNGFWKYTASDTIELKCCDDMDPIGSLAFGPRIKTRLVKVINQNKLRLPRKLTDTDHSHSTLKRVK